MGSAEHPMDDFVITFFNAGVGATLMLTFSSVLLLASYKLQRRPAGARIKAPGEEWARPARQNTV